MEHLTEKHVVEVLRGTQGIEERNRLISLYSEFCERQADEKARADPDNAEVSNRANIESAIKVARVYAQVPGMKDTAQEALLDVRLAASQNKSTLDFIPQIDELIDSVEKS